MVSVVVDMSTTLELYWNLSSISKEDRLDSSVQLVEALQNFNEDFTPSESNSHQNLEALDIYNAPDVSYAIRRLVKGLVWLQRRAAGI